MTAYQLLIVEPADLADITVRCGCGARITVPVGAPLVERCPSCHKDFDKPTQTALVKFDDFCRAVALSPLHFEFPIQRVQPDQP